MFNYPYYTFRYTKYYAYLSLTSPKLTPVRVTTVVN